MGPGQGRNKNNDDFNKTGVLFTVSDYTVCIVIILLSYYKIQTLRASAIRGVYIFQLIENIMLAMHDDL